MGVHVTDRHAIPTLIVVSGPPGSGKTTLAHRLAKAIPCPAVCRDEIKEGMVHATGSYVPSPGDALTARTFSTFFRVLDLLLSQGVSVIAEAAFQNATWTPNLEHLTELARLRVVQCQTDPATAERRIREHATRRRAHADLLLLESLRAGEHILQNFQRLDIGAPSILVDTTSGYEPGLETVVAFVSDLGPRGLGLLEPEAEQRQRRAAGRERE